MEAEYGQIEARACHCLDMTSSIQTVCVVIRVVGAYQMYHMGCGGDISAHYRVNGFVAPMTRMDWFFSNLVDTLFITWCSNDLRRKFPPTSAMSMVRIISIPITIAFVGIFFAIVIPVAPCYPCGRGRGGGTSRRGRRRYGRRLAALVPVPVDWKPPWILVTTDSAQGTRDALRGTCGEKW